MTDWPAQRLAPPDPATLDARQRAVHAEIAAGPRGVVQGPLAVWLHRPELAAHAQALGRYCRYDSALEPRLSELAILVMARAWSAEFEWYAHKPEALRAGLAPATVEAIRTGTEPEFADALEEVVFRFSVCTIETRAVPDALYARAAGLLGRDRLVDLVGLLGYYTLISMTLKVFRISPPAGVAPELG